MLPGLDAEQRCSPRWSASAARSGCGSAARSAGSPPTTRACTATRSAPCRPAACPRRSSPTCATRCERILAPLRAHARPVHDRRGARALRRRSVERAGGARARRRRSCAASCARAAASASGATPRCCAGCAARRWPCCARRSRPPTSARSPRFLPSWQGVDRHPAGRRRGRPPARGRSCRCRAWRCPAEVWERDVLPRRIGAYSPTWLDQLCASGEVVWVGAGALGRNSRPRRAVLPRRRRGDRPAGAGRAAPSRPSSPSTSCVRERLARGAVLLHRPAGRAAARARGAPGGAVGPRLGRRGDQRRLGAAARPAADARPRPARGASAAARPRAGASARRRTRRAGAGPGPLVADRARLPRASRRSRHSAAARSPSCCSSATASSRASRCWPRASPAASRALYDALGDARDARRLPPRLLRRGPRRRAVRAARARSSACARSAPTRRRRRSCSPRPTRPSPTAPRCPGPSATTSSGDRAARRRGAYVVLAGAEPVALRRARRPRAAMLVDADDPRLRPALEALAGFVTRPAARSQLVARARRRRARRRLALGGAARRARLPQPARASSRSSA